VVWDVLFQLGAALLVGAAVGYGVAAIVDALSTSFRKLWEELVGAAQEIWGYVTEATQHLLAITSQWMDRNWAEIENYLRQEIGYRSEWWVAVFSQGAEIFIAFIDPLSSQEESRIISLGALESDADAQLPTNQNPLIRKLYLN
jgi:hypothetical protein